MQSRHTGHVYDWKVKHRHTFHLHGIICVLPFGVRLQHATDQGLMYKPRPEDSVLSLKTSMMSGPCFVHVISLLCCPVNLSFAPQTEDATRMYYTQIYQLSPASTTADGASLQVWPW